MARRFFILNFWFLILCARRCHSRLAVLMLLRCLHQRMLRLERRRWCYENIFAFALAPFNKFLFFAIFKCSAALVVFDLFFAAAFFEWLGFEHDDDDELACGTTKWEIFNTCRVSHRLIRWAKGKERHTMKLSNVERAFVFWNLEFSSHSFDHSTHSLRRSHALRLSSHDDEK